MDKINRALAEYLYPKVHEVLSDPKKDAKFRSIMSELIGKHAEKLSSYGPTDQMPFPEKTKNEIYKLFDTSDRELMNIKKHSTVIKDGHTMGHGLNILLPMVIRHYSLVKNTKMVEMTVFFNALYIYPLVYSKFFKYQPSPNVMAYTINNLSNKYRIKQDGILESSITDIAVLAYDLHKDGIDKGTDEDAMQYVLALRTRLNAFLRRIATVYYKNHKEGKFLNVETEVNDEDAYIEAEASIYEISNIVHKVTTDLVLKGPDIKLITISAKANTVSVRDLKTYLHYILQKGNLQNINLIIESILVIYMDKGRNRLDRINSTHFLTYTMDVYRRSNAEDKEVITIKNILNDWMNTTPQVKKTNNVATMNLFRRAIYMYFILAIQYVNAR